MKPANVIMNLNENYLKIEPTKINDKVRNDNTHLPPMYFAF